MSSSVTPTQVNRYYDPLQSTMNEVQQLVPKTNSTTQHQREAVQKIALGRVAENSQFTNEIQDKLQGRVDKYVELSHRLNDYNEIYNTNKYISDELERTNQRVDATKNKLKNTIYVSKQKTQTYEYEKFKWAYYRTLLLVTAFVVIDLLTVVGIHLQGGVSETYLYVIMGITALAYVVIMSVFIYSNSFRSKSDWNKYMWQGINQSSSGSCV